MIINGGARGNVGYWSSHLLKDENDRAEVKEIKGVLADNLHDALREMELIASASRCEGNFMYAANINPRGHERLTEDQWRQAVDLLEEKLGMVGHQRIVVEHEDDEGRIHRHIIWNRVGLDLKVSRQPFNYLTHERVARALETGFDLTPTPSRHGMQHDGPRPDRASDVQEYRLAEKAGTTPQDRKSTITEARQQAISPEHFAHTVREAGYILALGDRAAFVVVDRNGAPLPVVRVVAGGRADELGQWLDEIRDTLPSFAEAKAMQRELHGVDQAERTLTPRQAQTLDRKTVITDAWNQSDSPRAFEGAVSEAGYVLAIGKRRDFVVVDRDGNPHSVARQVERIKAKDVVSRLDELRDTLPNWEQAVELQRQARETIEAEAKLQPAEIEPPPIKPIEIELPLPDMKPQADIQQMTAAEALQELLDDRAKLANEADQSEPIPAEAQTPEPEPVVVQAEEIEPTRPLRDTQRPPEVAAEYRVERVGQPSEVEAKQPPVAEPAPTVDVPTHRPPPVAPEYRVENVGPSIQPDKQSSVEEPKPEPVPQPKSWREQKIDERKEVFTSAWNDAPKTTEFVSALNAAGYVLARGEGGNIIAVDSRGYPVSLAKSIDGVEPGSVRHRMHYSRLQLPSFEDAKALQIEAAEAGKTVWQYHDSAGDLIDKREQASATPAWLFNSEGELRYKSPPELSDVALRLKAEAWLAQKRAEVNPPGQRPPEVPQAYKRESAGIQSADRAQPVDQSLFDRFGGTVEEKLGAAAHEVSAQNDHRVSDRLEKAGSFAAAESSVERPPEVPAAYKVETFRGATSNQGEPSQRYEVRPSTLTESKVVAALNAAQSPKELEQLLAEDDLKLAVPTAQEVKDSRDQADWARQNGHSATRPFGVDEVVVVGKSGHVTRIRPDMIETGKAPSVMQNVAGLDRDALKGVMDTKADQAADAAKASSRDRDFKIAVTPTVTPAGPSFPKASINASFKVIDKATGAITGLLDFLTSTPALPPPRHQVEQRQRDEAAIAALERVCEAASKGEGLKAEDLRHLSPEHLLNLKLNAPDALRDMMQGVDYYLEQERQRDNSRGR